MVYAGISASLLLLCGLGYYKSWRSLKDYNKHRGSSYVSDSIGEDEKYYATTTVIPQPVLYNGRLVSEGFSSGDSGYARSRDSSIWSYTNNNSGRHDPNILDITYEGMPFTPGAEGVRFTPEGMRFVPGAEGMRFTPGNVRNKLMSKNSSSLSYRSDLEPVLDDFVFSMVGLREAAPARKIVP